MNENYLLKYKNIIFLICKNKKIIFYLKVMNIVSYDCFANLRNFRNIYKLNLLKNKKLFSVIAKKDI